MATPPGCDRGVEYLDSSLFISRKILQTSTELTNHDYTDDTISGSSDFNGVTVASSDQLGLSA